ARARPPGLHDVGRAARRRRRGADPRRPAPAAYRPARPRAGQAKRGGTGGAPGAARDARPTPVEPAARPRSAPRADHARHPRHVHGEIIVAGDFARMARPDNIRFTDAGDLLIMEEHGSSDFAQPGTGGVNQAWVLPVVRQARRTSSSSQLPNRFEPTGPWFSNDNSILYLLGPA